MLQVLALLHKLWLQEAAWLCSLFKKLQDNVVQILDESTV